MNKIKTLLVAIAGFISANAFAQTIVPSPKTVVIEAGKTADVEFVVENETETKPALAEFFLYLPEGITISYDEDEEDYVYEKNSDMLIKSHTVGISKRADGSFYVLVKNESGKEFKSTSGAYLTLTLEASANFTGVGEARMTDIHLVKLDASKFQSETENSFTITDGEVTAPAYFLVGNMNDWTASADYQLTRNEGAADFEEYMITLDLEAGAEFKVVKPQGENLVWYPDYVDNYKVTEAGKYNIYFRPNGDGGDDWYYNVIYVEKNITDGIRGINANGTTGDVYNTAGQRVSRTTKGLYIQNGKKFIVK